MIGNKAEKKTEAPNSLQGGTEQILFVDDEESLVEIGKEMLERLGYKVESRVSAYDALAAFRAQPDKYDLIITDMTMPKMTGETLAAKIKKIRPEIPIIICTGYSSRVTHENSSIMGIRSILMKPLTLSDLAKTVRKVLDENNS
jgi:DNA-binding NtrC family response regulator